MPKTSIGPIRIGMKKGEFENVLGECRDTFKRVQNDTNTIYAYDPECVHLTCGTNGEVRVISVFRPKKVFLEDIQILGKEIPIVCDELNRIGYSWEREDGGYWIEKAGILLIDVDDKVDGIELYP